MQLNVFEGFELVDVINSWVSFQHTRKYSGAGDFGLTLNTLDYVDSLIRDNYIVCEGDCYVIENVHKYKNGRKEMTLEVSGRHLSSILDRRVFPSLNISTAASHEAQMYSLVNSHFVNPTNSNRKIPNMTMAVSKGLAGNPTEATILANLNVLEVLEQLSEASGLGFRMNYQPQSMKMEFEIYRGRDLTDEVFFSEEYENVSDSDVYEQGRDYRNVGYLNDGVATSEVGSASGLDRREFILDGDMAAVKAELAQRAVLHSAECEILLTDQFTYREDWDLGDMVTFVDKGLGIVVAKPVIEIRETYTNRLEVDVVFGDRIPSVFEKLKGA